MGVHDLNFRLNICDASGFRRPGVTHECGQDAVCASHGARVVEDLWTHHRTPRWRCGCTHLGLRRFVSRDGLLAIDMARVLARHRGLRIKRFLGTSENAVKTQIWCAVSTYVLIAIIRKEFHLDASLYTLLQILSISVFEKTQLSCALQPDTTRTISPPTTNQRCASPAGAGGRSLLAKVRVHARVRRFILIW